MGNPGALVKLRLLLLLNDGAQNFLQEPGGLRAIGALETEGVDANVPMGRHEYFNGLFHNNYRQAMVSLMEPFGCAERLTRCPLRRASRMALWTP